MTEFLSYLRLLGIALSAIMTPVFLLAALIVPMVLVSRGKIRESHLAAGLSSALAFISLGLVVLLLEPANWVFLLFMLVAAGVSIAVSILVSRAFR